MPSYYRRYLASSRGNRRWRRTGWWRSFGRGRRGPRSAYTSGRRRVTLRVPVEAQAQFTIEAGSNWSNLLCIQPFLSYKSTSANKNAGVASLVSSPLYRNYATLYDQVKIDSVYVSGSVIEGIGIGGSFDSLSFASAWDRNIQPVEVKVGGAPGITAQTIQYGSEAQTFLLTNNSKQLVHRWNRASDLLEKATFHDCSVALAPAASQYRYYDVAFFPLGTASENANGGLGYVPGLWMAFYSPQTVASPRTVNVTFKVIWNVTFRNPKYGLAAESVSKEGAMDEVGGEGKEEEKEEEKEVEE